MKRIYRRDKKNQAIATTQMAAVLGMCQVLMNCLDGKAKDADGYMILESCQVALDRVWIALGLGDKNKPFSAGAFRGYVRRLDRAEEVVKTTWPGGTWDVAEYAGYLLICEALAVDCRVLLAPEDKRGHWKNLERRLSELIDALAGLCGWDFEEAAGNTYLEVQPVIFELERLNP